MDSSIVDQIYEAAVLPDRWPGILQSVAARVGAMGGVFMSTSANGTEATVSPALERHLADYIAEGWAADPVRTAPLLAEQHPGFRVEIDFRTVEQVECLPVHAEFLDRRGLIAGAATAIQGPVDRSLFLAFEGFCSHEASRAAVPYLDTLRPHLARAISLTALRPDGSQLIVDGLGLTGAAAAVVSREGRLSAANSNFLDKMAGELIEGPLGLRFADPFLQRQFALALARHGGNRNAVQSVAVKATDGQPPFAIHLLPIAAAARERCDCDGVLLLIADAANAVVPDADLLRLLFDLTPAEARLGRLIAQGWTLADASRELRISESTARVQLKSVFLKAGVKRQAELVRLLSGLGAPNAQLE